MPWNTYCIVRLSLIYRGRAIPIVWKVLEHGSATVAYDDYHTLWDQVAQVFFLPIVESSFWPTAALPTRS